MQFWPVGIIVMGLTARARDAATKYPTKPHCSRLTKERNRPPREPPAPGTGERWHIVVGHFNVLSAVEMFRLELRWRLVSASFKQRTIGAVAAEDLSYIADLDIVHGKPAPITTRAGHAQAWDEARRDLLKYSRPKPQNNS